jgi:hypothetical protein
MPSSKDNKEYTEYPEGRILQTHQRLRQSDLSLLLKDTNHKRKSIYSIINSFVESIKDKKFSKLQTRDYDHAKQIIFSEFSHLNEETHNIASVNS